MGSRRKYSENKIVLTNQSLQSLLLLFHSLGLNGSVARIYSVDGIQ